MVIEMIEKVPSSELEIIWLPKEILSDAVITLAASRHMSLSNASQSTGNNSNQSEAKL